MRTRILIAGTLLALAGIAVSVTAAPAPKPAKPAVALKAVQNLTSTGVTLVGTLDPKGSPTTFQFQYGTTKSYGSTSGPVAAGTAKQTVTANLAGLTPNTTYHYRLVATNSVGTSMTGDKTFKTTAQPTTISLTAKPSSVLYGRSTTLSGQLTGPNAANQQVTLKQNPFPYTGGGGGFKNVGTPVTSDANGNFTFAALPLTINTQFQATAGRDTESAVVTVLNRVIVRLGVKTRVRRHSRVRFAGTVTPPEDGALYAIQRRSSTGRWVTVAGGALAHYNTTRSRYVRRVRVHRNGTYRVFVSVTEGGHVSNHSSARRIRVVG